MSTTEVRATGAESTERTISRAVAEFSTGTGRTIDVCIVPYGITTEVSDGGPVYREVWMPGAFADQVRGAQAGRARQVFVNFEHGNRLSDVIGHGLTLREESERFLGSFELHDTADGEKARYMVEQGLLDGVSLEAYPKKTVRSKDGVVQRVKAHLVNIALCRRPAYEGAGVLALREEELMQDEYVLPVMSDEVRERLHRIGMTLPEEEDLIERTFTERPWDGSASRWDTPEAYCAASVLDLNPPGAPKTKQMCHLPIKEPGTGEINVHAVRAALSRIGQGFPSDATAVQRESARTRLEKLLAQANGGTTNRAQLPAQIVAEDSGAGGSDDDMVAMGHLDDMLESAQNYMSTNSELVDQTTMSTIVGQINKLRQAVGNETAGNVPAEISNQIGY